MVALNCHAAAAPLRAGPPAARLPTCAAPLLQQSNAGIVGDDPVREGIVSGFLLIFLSEIGDKTFFIALLLALKQSKVRSPPCACSAHTQPGHCATMLLPLPPLTSALQGQVTPPLLPRLAAWRAGSHPPHNHIHTTNLRTRCAACCPVLCCASLLCASLLRFSAVLRIALFCVHKLRRRMCSRAPLARLPS